MIVMVLLVIALSSSAFLISPDKGMEGVSGYAVDKDCEGKVSGYSIKESKLVNGICFYKTLTTQRLNRKGSALEISYSDGSISYKAKKEGTQIDITKNQYEYAVNKEEGFTPKIVKGTSNEDTLVFEKDGRVLVGGNLEDLSKDKCNNYKGINCKDLPTQKQIEAANTYAELAGKTENKFQIDPRSVSTIEAKGFDGNKIYCVKDSCVGKDGGNTKINFPPAISSLITNKNNLKCDNGNCKVTYDGVDLSINYNKDKGVFLSGTKEGKELTVEGFGDSNNLVVQEKSGDGGSIEVVDPEGDLVVPTLNGNYENGNFVANGYKWTVDKDGTLKGESVDEDDNEEIIYYPSGNKDIKDLKVPKGSHVMYIGETDNDKSGLFYDQNGNIVGAKDKTGTYTYNPSTPGMFTKDDKTKCSCSKSDKNSYCGDEICDKWSDSQIGHAFQQAFQYVSFADSLSYLLGLKDNSWRKMADEFFSRNVFGQILSGRWEDSLCQSNIASVPTGTLYVDAPDGLTMVQTGAHVEGERIGPITHPNASSNEEVTEYLYKFNAYVMIPESSNEDEQEYSVWVRIYPGAKNIIKKQTLKPGESFSYSGQSAITKYSKHYYDKICILFDPEVSSSYGYEDKICNKISGPKKREQPTDEDESSDDNDDVDDW